MQLSSRFLRGNSPAVSSRAASLLSRCRPGCRRWRAIEEDGVRANFALDWQALFLLGFVAVYEGLTLNRRGRVMKSTVAVLVSLVAILMLQSTIYAAKPS